MTKNKPILHELIDKFDALEPKHERPTAEEWGWLVAAETMRETGKTDLLVEKLRSGDPISAKARNWLADVLEGKELPTGPTMNDLRWSLLAASRDYYHLAEQEWSRLFLKADAMDQLPLSENQRKALSVPGNQQGPRLLELRASVLNDRNRRLELLATIYSVPQKSLENFINGEGTPAKGQRRALKEMINRASPERRD